MRILYFSREYSPHDHRFLSALGKTGQEVAFLRLERGPYPLEQRPLPAGVEAVEWKGGRKPYDWVDLPNLLLDLVQVIDRLKPDLIQAGPIQTAALLVALAGFHPLIATSWGSDLLRDADRDPTQNWAARRVLAHADALVGDCQAVRDKAVALGMPSDRIVTFPWGVDLSHFHPPSARHCDPSHFTLISTRSWEPIYGVDVLARAFVRAHHILEGQGFSGLRLLLLADGSQAAELRQIFEQGSVAERVEFAGQVGLAALPTCYAIADLYLAASHSDGSSISLLEAMACGLPVLVSDIPGNREWITPGQQGWLFPDGDVEAMAAGIVQAVNQRDQLSRMGEEARQLAEARANWTQNFQQLLHAYEIGRQNPRFV